VVGKGAILSSTLERKDFLLAALVAVLVGALLATVLAAVLTAVLGAGLSTALAAIAIGLGLLGTEAFALEARCARELGLTTFVVLLLMARLLDLVAIPYFPIGVRILRPRMVSIIS